MGSSAFLPVVILIAVAAVVAIAIPVISSLLGRRRPDSVKGAPYECGVAELDSVHKRISIRYYMTALTFIVFDVEIAFLVPIALVLKKAADPAKVYLFFAMIVFLTIILLAYAWEWKKGALEWD